jgi:hypothetical protein
MGLSQPVGFRPCIRTVSKKCEAVFKNARDTKRIKIKAEDFLSRIFKDIQLFRLVPICEEEEKRL